MDHIGSCEEGIAYHSRARHAETESKKSDGLLMQYLQFLRRLLANGDLRLKCNRTQPCENCVKRGDALSCSYAAPGSRKKHSGTSSSSSGPGDMQNRIDRLEGLVLSLMTNGAQSAGPAAASRSLSMSASTGSMEYPPDMGVDGVNNQNGMMRPDGEEGESETDQVAQSLGILKVFDNKSMYFGDAHWATILQDVRLPPFSHQPFTELTRPLDNRGQELLCRT